MPKELDVISLNESQRDQCVNTISHNTFYMLVADALCGGRALSVVRMGDGERRLLEHARTHSGEIKPPNSPFDETWLKTFGCYGIPCTLLAKRIERSATECTYFSPQVMGIQRPEWAMTQHFSRVRYVDNWFVHEWGHTLQNQLYKQAKHVVFIHGDSQVRDAVCRRIGDAGASAESVIMSSWVQADAVIDQLRFNEAPLVLFSGGPANKYIGPEIATGGCKPKVVLDIGQAAAKAWV